MAQRSGFRRRRRRADDPAPIAALLKDSEAGRAIAAVAVPRKTWEEVAGVTFARRTAPERLERGTLWVAVASPAWAQELALHAPLILERLRARGVQVQQMRYHVGAVEPPARGGVVVPARAKLALVAAEAAATDPRGKPDPHVKDDALRAQIAATGRFLARAQAMEAERDKAARERKPRVPGKR